MDNTENKLESKKRSLTAVLTDVRDGANKFELNDAQWSLCRSVVVFVVGVALTLQLRVVIHDLIS